MWTMSRMERDGSPSAHKLPPLVPSTLYSVGASAASSGPLADQNKPVLVDAVVRVLVRYASSLGLDQHDVEVGVDFIGL